MTTWNVKKTFIGRFTQQWLLAKLVHKDTKQTLWHRRTIWCSHSCTDDGTSKRRRPPPSKVQSTLPKSSPQTLSSPLWQLGSLTGAKNTQTSNLAQMRWIWDQLAESIVGGTSGTCGGEMFFLTAVLTSSILVHKSPEFFTILWNILLNTNIRRN